MKSTLSPLLETNPYPTQKILFPELQKFKLQFYIKRLDLVHPKVSGNKFFKLKYNLAEAKEQGKDTLLTFGGAYSNHIQATAAAAQLEGFKSIGIIRGEPSISPSPTIQYALESGMDIQYMDRTTYRNKNSKEVSQSLMDRFGSFYMIPEGGTNSLAIKGTAEIIGPEDLSMDYICSCIGTGGTLAGLIKSSMSHQKTIGISSLKGDFVHDEIKSILQQHKIKHSNNYEIFTNYHFGGYAKHKPELIQFIMDFKKSFGIPLDPIYTGKLLYAVFDLVKMGYFKPNSNILVIHSGGLQGIRGFNEHFGTSLANH
ncbi:1-aminocyclopropane-1-carboxylate deaminase/D-cysteine desulfhydrase [Echinicola sp. CAU 1574]|uniref:1-aminocyclopropane-1-carboxylate deaminase/D-cysteine desulfhydrase n=1 Tax=Echinicola arenosa TaxID=2774144 RepID=A0ABR9AHT7_9BACT|nr:pyridoxal-phosphate dependent enzyme [Echinicola arenosa]MBD8488348.1 1-aminocyclopropane-1-carboxylate deaminase/D-cysteine desulfhydrase [Echinicola arenosa]